MCCCMCVVSGAAGDACAWDDGLPYGVLCQRQRTGCAADVDAPCAAECAPACEREPCGRGREAAVTCRELGAGGSIAGQTP